MTPVNVFSKIPQHKISLGSAALFDVLLLALMLSLVLSKFVLVAGLSVATDGGAELPSMGSPEYAAVDDSVSVLTVRGSSMLIFDGSIYNADGLSKAMKSRPHNGGVLLVKADKNTSLQTLVDVAEIAKSGGFKTIHIATTGLQK